jgi:hypothetical protein
MNWERFEPLATTVLYEGHLLYPYRPSALKNQRAWCFGSLHPAAMAEERSQARLEALIECDDRPRGMVRLVWLEGEGRAWAEAGIPGKAEWERGGVAGALQVELIRLGADLWRLSATAMNTTPEADAQAVLASAQMRCGLERGAFVSAQDPPPARAAEAAACHSDGLYPILAGLPGERDLLLGAPIIIEDHARVAAQSRGDFCDATEMDELLTLRVMTLSEAEQAEIRARGGLGQAILERCTAGPAPELHGGRAWDPYASPPAAVRCQGRTLRAGDRVRLHPRPGGDLFNRVLDGKAARIQAVEQEAEGAVQLAVVVDDDPGADLGEAKQTGHRFFFALEEVEPL